MVISYLQAEWFSVFSAHEQRTKQHFSISPDMGCGAVAAPFAFHSRTPSWTFWTQRQCKAHSCRNSWIRVYATVRLSSWTAVTAPLSCKAQDMRPAAPLASMRILAELSRAALSLLHQKHSIRT